MTLYIEQILGWIHLIMAMDLDLLGQKLLRGLLTYGYARAACW
jgi:hypothetical protein